MKEHHQRLDKYIALDDLTASEFISLPSCEIPGCAEHHTPLCTPTKINDLEFPSLPKTASVKRKENELEFVPPPQSYKLSKNQKTQPNPEQNFKLNLSNKFNALEITDTEIDPVEETSTGTAANNVTVKKNSTNNAAVNKSTRSH
ncbi:hypothetical protein TNCV_2214811 [Trichonephila clavipes]|nr:hypothetical protein TNCV_2214811 [Trichonephila clavipes]